MNVMCQFSQNTNNTDKFSLLSNQQRVNSYVHTLGYNYDEILCINLHNLTNLNGGCH